MKNILISLTLLFCFSLSQAQDRYAQGMSQAFKLWGEGQTMEASAIFQRIAQAEKDNWLPYYYAANTLITGSFQSKDQSKVNEMLEQAKLFIAEAHTASPENSEILTLEGLLYTAYVAMDPQTFAMQYSGKIMELHGQALALEPTNPRANFNKIEYEIGTARFFNKDLSTFCDAIENTRTLFENQKSDVPFYPSYGVERVESTLDSCNCKKDSK